MGSMGKRRGRRTRSDHGGRRFDIARGARTPSPGRTYDPPWRSISEGRGLPRTPIFKAMMPVFVLAAVAMLAVVLIGAALTALVG
jgi:hypothetical protein